MSDIDNAVSLNHNILRISKYPLCYIQDFCIS